MKKENKELCENMFAVANSYKTSAELLNVANELITDLARRQNIMVNGRPLEFGSVILSRLLLYSLNVEILLKALYLIEFDDVIKTHEWTEIFDHLPKARQQEIIEKMNPVFQTNFHDLLNENKNTFVEWRYSYENSKLKSDFSFVQNLTNVLAEIIMPIVN